MSRSSKLQIDRMATEIANALTNYNQEVSNTVKGITDEVAAETAKELKKTSPRLTGDYAKGWRRKKAYETQYEKRNTVFNEDQYQLTHLLEDGHRKVSTDRARRRHELGRTPARVHIEPVDSEAKEKLEERITKAVGKI